jgi:hypothetical protein
MNRTRQKQVPVKKVSEMLPDVAGGYIAAAEDLEGRHNLIGNAITAWNIGCLSKSVGEAHLRVVLEQYVRINQGIDPEDVDNFEYNLRLLINQKRGLYPFVKMQIVDFKIKSVHGQDSLAVSFVKNSSEIPLDD